MVFTIYSQNLYTLINFNDIVLAVFNPVHKIMKKIERTAKKVTEVILPTLYLAPMVIGAYGFISLVQWTS